MRSTNSATSGRPDQDLTTRARIRDAAIELFGREGFGTGVRAIATEAGVSVGLVNHHFGSKDGLRADCDAHVLELIRIAKTDGLQDPGGANLMRQLAEVEDFAPAMAYIVRSFQHGGPLAAALFEQVVSNTERYIEDAVAAGTIRASRDPAARARYLTMQSLGSTLLYLQFRSDREDPVDFRHAIRDMTEEIMLPAMEMLTEGLFTDRSILDTLLATTESKEDR